MLNGGINKNGFESTGFSSLGGWCNTLDKIGSNGEDTITGRVLAPGVGVVQLN